MKKLLSAAFMLSFATFASAQAPATTTTTTKNTKAEEIQIKAHIAKVKELLKARNEQPKTEAKNGSSVAKDPRKDYNSAINNRLSTIRAERPSEPTVESKPITGATLQTSAQKKDGLPYSAVKPGKKTNPKANEN